MNHEILPCLKPVFCSACEISFHIRDCDLSAVTWGWGICSLVVSKLCGPLSAIWLLFSGCNRGNYCLRKETNVCEQWHLLNTCSNYSTHGFFSTSKVSLWSHQHTLHLSHQIFLWIYAWWNLYEWEVIPVCNLRTPVSVSSQDALKFIFHCNEAVLMSLQMTHKCKWGILDISKKTSLNINRTLQKNYYTWWILLHTYIYVFIHRAIIHTSQIKCWIQYEKS